MKKIKVKNSFEIGFAAIFRQNETFFSASKVLLHSPVKSVFIFRRRQRLSSRRPIFESSITLWGSFENDVCQSEDY